MKKLPYDVDICVIGAGPAGSITAARLASLGYSVCIIEGKAFPRPHVGICFSDDTYPLLDYIGVTGEIKKASFLQRRNTLLKWQTEAPQYIQQTGFHADRGVFDQILLRLAVSAGVKVLQPAKVTMLYGQDGGWKVAYEHAEGHNELSACFVVDASGSGNVLPGKKKRLGPPLFAMHAKWHMKNAPDYDGFIEAASDSWLWFALLNDSEALVTLFTEPKQFLSSQNSKLDEHYRQMLQKFSLISMCELESVVTRVEYCDASSRSAVDPVGVNYIKVGDASFKVAPLASQGVYLAMLSAVQATVVVNTLLRQPENGLHAIEFYKSRVQERVENFTAKTAAAYGQVSRYMSNAFWKYRSGPAEINKQPQMASIDWPMKSELLMLSQHATIKPTPVMKGDFIFSSLTLHHSSLDRPIAYLGEQEIEPLLSDLDGGCPFDKLMDIWVQKISANSAYEIFSWLWNKGIIVTSTG